MINTVISTFLQILVFAAIPFIVFLVKNKSAKGFFNYIGLRKSTARGNYLAILVSLFMSAPLLVLTFVDSEFKSIMTDPHSITGMVKQMGFGFEVVFTLLIISIFKTAFAEELLFRGFIAKRLINISSFKTGNLIQAFLFGIIHLAIFMSITGKILFLILIFLFPAVGAYLIVHINEKLANGRILPG